MKEIWKPIRNYEGLYEGLYEVSNRGRVKSLERTVRCGRGYRIIPEKILEGVDNGHGYLRVNLCKEGKVNQPLVHVLVATAFCENLQGYKEVNHLSEDKTDNSAKNLEWVSHEYNCNYGTRNKRMAEKLRGRKQTEEHIKKNSKPVFSVNKESGLIMWWQSAKEAERQTGIAQASINRCCRGKQKSAGGYYWHYVDSEEVANEQE